MSKNKKTIIGILIVVLIIAVGGVVAYKLIANNVTNRENFKFKVENISSNPVETVNHEKKYSKVIDNIKLELNIPNEWKYEEMQKNNENDFYKYALKLYKSNENQYAMLYFYNNQFGVCGTGRTSENISLNNGKEATIGYYDGNKDWSDISFYNMNKNVAVINYGLTNADADEAIEFIKTINITEDIKKTTENFEILFYDKHPMESYKIYTILDKSETEEYDYTIYGYDGSVNIRIDSKDYSLKEALLKNKITMEEIIEKANKVFPDAISYDDGGSMEYHYDNYTIIKCNRLDGNRDVYIGTKDMTLNDVL